MKRFLIGMSAMAALALVAVAADAKPASGSSKGGNGGTSKGGSISKSSSISKGGSVTKADPVSKVGSLTKQGGKLDKKQGNTSDPSIGKKNTEGTKDKGKVKDNNDKSKIPDYKKDKPGKQSDDFKGMKGKDYCKKFGGDCHKPYCFKSGKCIDWHGHCHKGFGCNFWSHRCYSPDYGCYLYYDHGCCDWFYWCEPYGCYYPIHFVPCGVYSFETIVIDY